jgi:threonine dehydratase
MHHSDRVCARPADPAHAWPLLRTHTAVDVVVKHENHTPIDAFKVRGRLVSFDRMKRDRLQRRRVAVIVSGQNIDRSLMQTVLTGGTPRVA